ncbi:DUF362 domain-containing protein [Desulfomonile tiedjei]|uniref:4Fe-4S ferredoxin-type domain-containing protein n=1 Tax=Desulfomonile tiedjei (strain ATCC 49306 / DSM 6799 / DCB-1) TaxID=706587 RepID=I4C3M6_DESTA|nr:DUF362 domain-containing protein [Desulfomonile tiedjei]AFM24167.1 hypothetical protein Desti_1455 [Desulfomonile tiedjei DSM 6799]
MKTFVSLRTCKNYEPESLNNVVETLLNDLGGISSFVKPGDRVLLKPNLLKSATPDEAIVTHPALVEAVAAAVLDVGASVSIGDSPPLGNLSRVLSKSGYDALLQRLPVKVAPFRQKISVEFTDDRLFRKIDLAQEVFEYDCVINLPKLKTHTQMVLTLGVKNLFGTLVGTDKASWHLRAGTDVDTFATVLVQIYEKVKPALTIIDGILAMEGNGPNSGTPRHLGIVGAATDAVALDSVICKLIGHDSTMLRTCVIGNALGAGTSDPEQITVVGDELRGFPLNNFKMPESATVTWNMSDRNPLRRFLQKHMVTVPEIDASICERCGICANHCPPAAIREIHGKMEINRDKCISCFCCHELCSHRAVRIVQPLLGKILTRVIR